MSPAEESHHLLAAFRQLGHDGKRGLVQRIHGAAERGGAVEVTAMCERMLDGDEYPAELFAHVAVGYVALDPAVKLGRKFTAGRKAGTVGKVRAWVRKFMVMHPDAMPAQVWEAFKKRPPKGCTIYENRVGNYIETDGAPDTSRAWFGTIVGQERPKG